MDAKEFLDSLPFQMDDHEKWYDYDTILKILQFQTIPLINKEKYYKEIDGIISDERWINAQFGVGWKDHALDNYTIKQILDIAVKNGRELIVLKGLMEYESTPKQSLQKSTKCPNCGEEHSETDCGGYCSGACLQEDN